MQGEDHLNYEAKRMSIHQTWRTEFKLTLGSLGPLECTRMTRWRNLMEARRTPNGVVGCTLYSMTLILTSTILFQ